MPTLGPIDILVNDAGLHDPQRAEKLTRQLAVEWGKRGITVDTLAPGYLVTDLTGATVFVDGGYAAW